MSFLKWFNQFKHPTNYNEKDKARFCLMAESAVKPETVVNNDSHFTYVIFSSGFVGLYWAVYSIHLVEDDKNIGVWHGLLLVN